MQIFQWNNVNGKIELNTPEILLIKEFSVLFDNNRNKCRNDFFHLNIPSLTVEKYFLF